ncbi:MAG: YcaO-like family protein [Pseudonocardiaceae bacterium]
MNNPHSGPGRLRLIAGCHLYPVTDGTWRCALPGGRFIRLRGPDPALRRLHHLLHGHAAPDAADGIDPAVAEVISQLDRRGLLAVEPDDGPPARSLLTRVVQIEGDNPIAELTTQLLTGHVTVRRGRLERDTFAGLSLAVSCAGWLPDARWRLLDAWSAEHGVGWHRIHADGDRFVIGPCSQPGRTPSYTDTRARRLAAAGLPDELEAHWGYLDDSGSLPAVPWPSPGGVALLAGLLVDDVLAALAGRARPAHQLEVDPATAAIHRHPVLPLPDLRPPTVHRLDTDPDPDDQAASASAEQLVGPRLGLITRLTPQSAPAGTFASCLTYLAHVADTGRFASWVADRETSGAAFRNADAARQAAVGEAVERYCGNAVPEQLPVTAFTKLAAAGRRAIDPGELALYSDAQYGTPGFPFVPLTGDLEVAWVPGRDLTDGAETLVPASLVYLNYHRSAHAAEPATNGQAFAGIAAGPTTTAATVSALAELLERDAVTMWWTSGAPATRVDIAPDSDLGAVLADPDTDALDVTFLQIPSPFDVPVLAAYLVDRRRRLVALGTACRATASAAAFKALTEAVGTHRLNLELLDGDCAFWQAVAAGRIDPSPYHPFRADRRYRDSFRADWRDVHDLSMHLQLYLDPRMHDEHLARLTDPPATVALTALPGAGPDPLATYVHRLAAQGLRPVAVDLTTSDVAATGWRVVRVVVAGLYTSAPAAFPLLGGRRLYRDPVARGWLPGPLTEDTVVRAPIPFA